MFLLLICFHIWFAAAMPTSLFGFKAGLMFPADRRFSLCCKYKARHGFGLS